MRLAQSEDQEIAPSLSRSASGVDAECISFEKDAAVRQVADHGKGPCSAGILLRDCMITILMVVAVVEMAATSCSLAVGGRTHMDSERLLPSWSIRTGTEHSHLEMHRHGDASSWSWRSRSRLASEWPCGTVTQSRSPKVIARPYGADTGIRVERVVQRKG